MTILSAKATVLTATFAVGVLLSSSAHAAILRSSDGVPVLTKDGNCVITNWEGSDQCEAAKAAAGIANADHADTEGVVYFDFNKATLTKSAKHALDQLAAKLAPHKHWDKDGKHHHHHHEEYQGPALTIVGYADRIGKAEYNERLALRRAQSVRTYLLSKGVKARKIEVRSLGKTSPTADCPADLPRNKLIDCLRPDRRVEIEVSH